MTGRGRRVRLLTAAVCRMAFRALFRFGDYFLVSRPDFSERHAYLVTGTLLAHASELPDVAPLAPGKAPIPVHAGALVLACDQLPPSPAGEDAATTNATD